MTDRTAALAEALHRATCGEGKHWTDGRDEPSDIEMTTARRALAALDAAGWGVWPNGGGYLAGVNTEAEIARLRRIEEAARALFDNFYGPIETWENGERSMVQCDHGYEEYEARIALRAALEEEEDR